jgi:ferrochelatase
LPEITQRTARKLEEASGLPTYVGMLHWHPLLEDTMAQMAAENVRQVLVICLVPHFSACGVGRYRRRVTAAAEQRGLAFTFVDDWHAQPAYLQGLADSVVAAWEELGCAAGERTDIIFSAHSLPKAAIPAGDPYETQLRETAELVAARLGLPAERWTVAFQSASGPHEAWLGPLVEDVVLDLARRGITMAVVCPYGYIANQVEVLYDLDVVAKRQAGEVGVRLARAPLLNDGPAVIDSLTELVAQWT